MDKKPRTPAQLANDAKLAARAKERAEARKNQAVNPELPGVEHTQEAPKPDVAQSTEQLSPTDMLLMRLMNEIDELKKNQKVQPSPEAALEATAQMQGVQPTLGKNGIQGQVFKYPVDSSYYPDPTERLYNEPSLRRFNLQDNYYFDWRVEGVEYEKYNITYAEPKFTVRIFRRMFEEDGITPSGQMALINTNILHEDELVARIAADKLGLREQFPDMRDLMDEVRYLRIRTWLTDLFTPPKVEHYTRRPRTMVVEGKVVEMYDTESLIDGEDGKAKAGAVARETRI